VPTMSVLFALKEDLFADRSERSQANMLEISRQKVGKVHDHALKGLEIMKRAGVKMGFGTDFMGHGQSTRACTELTLRRQVLTAFDVLHSATTSSFSL
jgi:imidazolonepropionase-like amidohydrolase